MEGSQDEAPSKLPQQQSAVSGHADEHADTIVNLALSDPPRWGWTAAGTLADLLPPHEVSYLIEIPILNFFVAVSNLSR
jgi:hypothetical protein